MPPFAPGQVVTVFRSRLRADAAPGYLDEAAELLARARAVPGFVDYKAFTADDGERVSIATFDGPESHAAWRDDERHRDGQQRGRADWYETYSVQVSSCASAHSWDTPTS